MAHYLNKRDSAEWLDIEREIDKFKTHPVYALVNEYLENAAKRRCAVLDDPYNNSITGLGNSELRHILGIRDGLSCAKMVFESIKAQAQANLDRANREDSKNAKTEPARHRSERY